MEAIVERCGGLDVHQATVVACVLVGAANQKARKEVRTFGTYTQDLVALRDWLASEGCTHVAMESTGIYWMPVYRVLEGHFELVVGNAERIRNVPGRKTDVKDAEWIANLLRHGLIPRSFVPPKPIRELRDLMRYRRSLVEARSAERNRLLRLLESANIKLATVASNVFGISGTLMVRALIDGHATPDEMARLAKGRLRSKMPLLPAALDGRLEDHHRELLAMQLGRLDRLETEIAELERRIQQRLDPYASQMASLSEIPGIDWTIAATIVSEVGVDMESFASAAKLACWAGLSPGNHESAGHRKREHTGKGNKYLKTALVQAAHAAARQRGSYFKAKFFALRGRMGPKKAVVAVAHKILIAAYHVLKTGVAYKDLGEGYLDTRSSARVASQLMRRLKRLGFTPPSAPLPKMRKD